MVKDGTVGLVNCPECSLRFIPQMTLADNAEADEVARLQRIEDTKLFGKKAPSEESGDPDFSRQILDVTEDIEIMEMSGKGRQDPSESRNPRINSSRNGLTGPSLRDVDSSLTASQHPQPPIMSWLSQAVPPRNPGSVREWHDTIESEQLQLREREAKDLEIFRNVQIVMPVKAGVPGPDEPSAADSEENDLAIGPRIHYRNILDRYPQIELLLARRLAIGNWERQKRLTAKQSEVEQAKIRTESWRIAAAGRLKSKLCHLKRETEGVVAEEDDWEDVSEKGEHATPKLNPHCGTELRADHEHTTFGHASWSLSGQPPPEADSLFFVSDASSLPTSLHGPNYQSYNLSPNISKPKERRFCSLPPLPIPLADNGAASTSMFCYLCHSQVSIRRKHDWR